METFDYGGNPQKRENPAGNRVFSENTVSESITSVSEHSTFRFSNGNAGIVQKKIIRHILAVIDGGFDNLSDAEKLKIAGMNAIRAVTEPYGNPQHHISSLRAINGADSILTIRVKSMRMGEHGQAPGYYWLPPATRQKWREALLASEVQP